MVSLSCGHCTCPQCASFTLLSDLVVILSSFFSPVILGKVIWTKASQPQIICTVRHQVICRWSVTLTWAESLQTIKKMHFLNAGCRLDTTMHIIIWECFWNWKDAFFLSYSWWNSTSCNSYLSPIISLTLHDSMKISRMHYCKFLAWIIFPFILARSCCGNKYWVIKLPLLLT